MCRNRDRSNFAPQIRITGLIGTYTDPRILIAYSDGEVRQEFTFAYAAEIESGELKIDDESKEAAWVPLSSAVAPRCCAVSGSAVREEDRRDPRADGAVRDS